MKRIINLVYSTKSTLWLLLIFAISMAVATFVEDRYDTTTAQNWVYKAKWFELVILLLAINFIGNIKRYNLLSKKKVSGLLFHLAFIVMIIGAGVTRYFGYEGLMHIREGQSSNIIQTPEMVLKVLAIDQGGEKRVNIPLLADSNASNDFKKSFSTEAGNDLEIKYKKYYHNATFTMAENQEDGVNGIKLNVLDNGRETDVFIAENDVSAAFSRTISFNNSQNASAFEFYLENGKYYLKTPVSITYYSMPLMQGGTYEAGSVIEMTPLVQFALADNSFKFIFNGGFQKAKPVITNAVAGSTNFRAFVFDVNFKGKSFEIPLILSSEGLADMQRVNVEGISLLLGYGEREYRLPFSIYLNDFILDRYPGSSAPSSYASEVTILDKQLPSPEKYKIYMNHILDHNGFRFFQSSYDNDEKGTILSVNHDFWGTWISYLGYFLLFFGFLWSLFSRSSRFQILGRSIVEIRKLRTGVKVLLFMVLGSSYLGQAQEVLRKPISPEHAERLGQLIVQTFDGRSEPVHTMAYDVLHKIARKDKFDLPGKGKMDAMQVFIDVVLDPGYWRNQRIIYVKEKSVSAQLGIEGKYASLADLVDKDQHFKLKDKVDEAFRKKPQEQNPFDKEVIKVGERMEIFMMMNQGSLLKLFPEPVAGSTVWISWDNPQAQIPLQDTRNILTDLNIPILNYNNFMGAYLNAAYTSTESGDFTRADRIVGYIEDVQRHSSVADLIPSQSQVKYEIYYNKAGIFVFLKNVYGILALFLLILAYTENFLEKKNKVVSMLLNFFLGLLGLAFAYHTFGMGMRWYLSGHAPWSNGYEALLLVGWAGILAGFTFIRYSKIPLAATALLAFFTLMTAGHSSYDPQITNLQPVLKSYWLVIHVATLTISYGFLGLAFILGILILTFYLFKNERNSTRFGLLIKELTHINEMNIIVGLMLATFGTFLGGVWANESWGRYWGWDAKETWALIITMVYSIVVHLRLVDKMRGDFIFTVGSVLAFSSVLMTFIGVNYYLSKGMHSYGAGETPIFPIWAWICILSVFGLIIGAGMKERNVRKKLKN